MKTNPKRVFDVTSKADIQRFKTFLKTSSWGPTGNPFKLEGMWLTVPDMIKDKIIKHQLKV